MTKIAGSISQRHGSADPVPDPHQNVMDPQDCNILYHQGQVEYGSCLLLVYLLLHFLKIPLTIRSTVPVRLSQHGYVRNKKKHA